MHAKQSKKIVNEIVDIHGLAIKTALRQHISETLSDLPQYDEVNKKIALILLFDDILAELFFNKEMSPSDCMADLIAWHRSSREGMMADLYLHAVEVLPPEERKVWVRDTSSVVLDGMLSVVNKFTKPTRAG